MDGSGSARRRIGGRARSTLRALTSELWDPELETLVMQVDSLLGPHIVKRTIDRAFLRQRLSATCGDVIPLDVFRTAVKAELRAVVRLH